MSQRVIVVGGGLGGLAAALAARRRGLDVTLAESHSYGRDKVCGEFLSAEVTRDLAAVGCGDWIDALGPIPLQRALLVASRPGHEARLELTLPGPPGLGITRRVLETWLAERARSMGVTVLERSPVQALAARRGGWRYRAGHTEGDADVAICAFGKRSALDGEFGLPRAHKPEVFAAAKAYFKANPAALEADVELHLIPGGYVGLSPVEGGRISLCALLEGETTHDFEALSRRFCQSPTLEQRLRHLGTPLGPVRGLARFGFGAQKLSRIDPTEGSVALFCGDAARMMPSFTGDGMAVALRSGRLAADALGAPDSAAAYARAYKAEFSARLRWAGLLHQAFFRPQVFAALAPILGKAPQVVDRLYALTRGR